ncbi:ATP-binding cassette domain-containing protein, partial [Streptococcus equi]
MLTGASGSGKSTLFALLCGEDKDYSGTIYFE